MSGRVIRQSLRRILRSLAVFAVGIGLCAAFAAEHMPKSASAARCLELALESEMGENALFRRDMLENGNALRVLRDTIG